jgi:ribosomal protein S27AE
MTNSDAERQGWLEAASILAETPDAKVLCPSCLNSILLAEDVPEADTTAINRRLTCGACGKVEEIYIQNRRIP